MNEKPLLILDLDETLIHATEHPKCNYWDFEAFHYKVTKRSYLNEFLSEISKVFTIAVWSSDSDDYVTKIVETIFPKDYPLLFVWGRSRATYKIDYNKMNWKEKIESFNHYSYIKRLSKVKRVFGISLENMLIVDDTPFKCQYNYGNAIYPSEFTGDPNDDELLLLTQYLIQLSSSANFRTIEKRNWKQTIHRG